MTAPSNAVAVLAATASGFAVVGLADVVLRLLHECVQCFWRCQSASDSVPKLLRELLSFSTIATNVRIFLYDYSRSLFALQDHKILLDFDTILRDCEHELEILKTTATALLSASTDPWRALFWKSLLYGIESKSIEKSCFQLERLKSALNSALSVTGRQNDIAIREAVGSAHKAVERTQDGVRELSQENQNGFRGVATALSTNHSAIQEDIAGINHNVRDVAITLETRTDQIREAIFRAGTLSGIQHSAVTTTLSNVTSTTDRSLETILATFQQQRRLLRKQHLSERKILASVANTRELFSSRAVRVEDEEIEFSDVDLKALVYPLCLMQHEFERLLESCVKEGIMDITVTESSWIHKEFKAILAASYAASARAINQPAHRSGPHYAKTPGRSTGRAETRKSRYSPYSRIKDTSPAASRSCDGPNELMTSRHNHRSVFHTPVGTLVIQSDKVKGHSNSKSTSFRFVFSPNPDMSSVGVSAKLTKTWNVLQGYTIQHHIRPSYVMRHNVKINNLLVADDVAGIQAMFSAGEASPFDCNEKGWSILDYAAWRSAPQAYKFLLEQGAGNDTLYPRSTEVAALGNFQPGDNSQAVNCFQILKMITERRLSSMWGRGGSLLHDLAYFDARWDFDCLPFADIINKLLEGGEDIDARDETGCTPLLNACYLGCSPMFIAHLLSKGADVNAVDTEGWNALHQVLFDTNRTCERYGRGYYIPDREECIARDTLDLLLRNGCNLQVSTKTGQSYEDFARFRSVKRLWNNALRFAGPMLDDSLRAEATILLEPQITMFRSVAREDLGPIELVGEDFE